MKSHSRFATLAIVISLFVIGTPAVSGQSLELVEWHQSVKKNAIFAWKMTDVELVMNESSDFLNGLLIQIKFLTNPPSDPSRIFNTIEAPDWMNIYINGFKIDFSQMGDMGEMMMLFNQLVSPITYHFDNGTSFNLDEIYRLATPMEGLPSYYTVAGSYVNTTLGNETIRFTTFTNIETGVVANISIYMEEMGSMLLEYYPAASNVDASGDEITIDDEYTHFQDPVVLIRNIIIVSAAIIGSIILVIVVFIIRRRRV